MRKIFSSLIKFRFYEFLLILRMLFYLQKQEKINHQKQQYSSFTRDIATFPEYFVIIILDKK